MEKQPCKRAAWLIYNLHFYVYGNGSKYVWIGTVTWKSFFFLFLIKPVFSDLWLMIIAAQQPPPSTLQLTATFQAWFSECVWERTRERETSVTPSQLYRKRCFLRRDTSFLVFLLVMQFAAVVKIAEQGIRKIEKGVILRFIFIQMLGIVGFGSSLCWFWF